MIPFYVFELHGRYFKLSLENDLGLSLGDFILIEISLILFFGEKRSWFVFL